MHRFIKKAQKKIHQAAEWRFTPLALFFISFADFFVYFIPVDGFFLAAMLGCTRRTLVFCIFTALGRVAGISAYYYLGLILPAQYFFDLARRLHLEKSWEQCLFFFEQFGAVSMGITSMTFFPVQFIAVISAQAGVSLLHLQVFLILGQVIRYAVLVSGAFGGKKFVESRHLLD